jgi:uncharacterized repeat protein (TIGR03803 family)
MHRLAARVAMACLVLSMSGCGGGGSSGPSGPPPVAVPNVVGMTQAAATTAITAAGLTVGTVTMQSSSTVASGDVISESPVAGASVANGSAVNLVISSGPATYPVSVSVTGLAAGTSLTVLDNGTDSLTFQSNTTQQFAIQLVLNATYSVTVGTQPAVQACTVAGGSGQVTGPVAVSVSCVLSPPSTSYPAFTAPYPLVQSGQTPAVVIASPIIIPVFFTNTPDQSATVAYLQALFAAPEWSVLSEYGVGSATVGTPVYLTSAAPTTTTTTDINSFVLANAASWAAFNKSQIFVLYYPSATTITDDLDYDYHTYANVSASQQIVYAVIQGYTLARGYNEYHELAEASTDPIIGEGYVGLNHDSLAWNFNEVELADMCEAFSLYFDPSLNQTMHGIWSDSAVNNSQAPCTSAGSVDLGFGFGAYPVLPDTYLAYIDPVNLNASVGIAPGASVTIPINVFSYGPLTAPINVTVAQLNTNTAGTNALTFALDQDYGLNGSVLHLTITAPQTPLSTTTNYASFLIATTLPASNNNNPISVFPGLVTNPGASCSSIGTGSSSNVETVLYGFAGGTDGFDPSAPLVQGSDGNFYGTTLGNYYEPGVGTNQYGSVFKITPSGTLTALHDFSSTDGATAFAGLVQGSDGNFYGTTTYGGGSNDGTVFKITPTGTLTTLHSFSGTDGSNPYGSLAQGSDGNFYGTTVRGPNGNGTVFEITPGGTLTNLYSFSGGDGSTPVAGLVLGSDGNFYGINSGGGASNDGTVFKITTSGALTTLHSFNGTDGANPYASLAQGSDGNFYGTTIYGGTSNYGTVFKITPSGTLTTLYSFSGADPYVYGGLVQGSDGNFYGTTYLGGTYDVGTVFSITPSGTLTSLYSFTDSFTSVPDGEAPMAGLVQGSSGSFYGTTTYGGGCGGGTIFEITPGSGGSSPPSGTAAIHPRLHKIPIRH